ncbi:MAG TPA: histidine kinase [Stackebrandtia sp.]|uniref:sensor histidine kinase n=1 Tax=Stackebrandtia sp. TaxID=2023065 RepID=UPI002D688D4C|nr:histidine kinase [Stackebrandtia sp.]HZE41600.1 histidine kinase [Stackebrandtia sp.]
MPWWQRVAPDLAVAVVVAGLAVAATWRSWPHEALPAGWSAALVVVSGLAVGLLRYRPLVVCALQAALLVVGDAWAPFSANIPQLCLLVALGFVAVRHGWVVSGGAYLVGVATTALNVDDPGSGNGLSAWGWAGLALMLAAPVAIGAYVAAVKRGSAEARAHRRDRERTARLAERTRLARDLHDIVAHHVGAMVLRAGAARYAEVPPEVDEALADIRDTGTLVLQDLRGLLEVLREPDSTDVPLPVTDARDLVCAAVERARGAGLDVEASVDEGLDDAPVVARSSAVRLVQEGLTNVLKHAGPGARARVLLSVNDRRLVVEIGNAAAAGTPAPLPSTGYGLAGMRERVTMLGGDFQVGPAADGGWLVRAAIPLGERP